MLPAGTRVNEYEILKTLGRGKLGITYLAKDHSLGREVVLKEYMPEGVAKRLESGEVVALSEVNQSSLRAGLKHFSKEAQTLAQFTHPAIVSVQRIVPSGANSAFIAVEYLDGENLEEKVQRSGTLDWDTLRPLLAQLLSGCGAVHELGIVHGHIKPSNIMLVTDEPKLIDFGSAQQLDHQGAAEPRLVDGYSSLEQYAVDQQQDAFTDIYGLAATVYFTIVGEAPTAAPARVAGQKLKAVRKIGGNAFPETLYNALDWGLQLREQDRPKSIAEWITAFPDLNDTTVIVEREVIREVVTQGVDRRTLALGGATVAALAAVAGAGFFLTRPRGKLEPSGSPVELSVAKSKTLGNLADDSYAKIITSNGSAYVAAHTGSSLPNARLALYRFGPGLTEKEPLFVSARAQTMGFALTSVQNGDLVVGGSSDFTLDSSGSPRTRMLLHRISPTGQERWEKRYGKGNMTSLAVLESGLAFAGEDPSRGKIDALTVVDGDGNTVLDAVEIGKKSDESIEKLVAGGGDNFFSLNFRFRQERQRTGSVVRSLGLVAGEVIEPWTYSDEAYLADVGIDSSVPLDLIRMGDDLIMVGQIRESGKSLDAGGVRGTYISRIDAATGVPIWIKHQLLSEERAGQAAELSAVELVYLDGVPILLCAARLLQTGQAMILQISGSGELIKRTGVPSLGNETKLRDLAVLGDQIFAIADEVDNNGRVLRAILLDVAS